MKKKIIILLNLIAKKIGNFILELYKLVQPRESSSIMIFKARAIIIGGVYSFLINKGYTVNYTLVELKYLETNCHMETLYHFINTLKK